MIPLKLSVGRIAIFGTILLLIGAGLGAGTAAAHNPACHQVAGGDGPHYDDSERTGSDTAFEKNKNLGGDEHPDHSNAQEGCSVGNSQSPHSDN